MTYDRYYYSTLNDTQKAAYKKAYAAFERFENTILFDGANTSVEDVLRVLYAIDLDNPHMYYVDFGKIEIKCNTRFVFCDAAYFYNRTEIAQIQPKIQKTTNAILKRVSGATTYEKVLSLHDILAENILYDDNAADDIDKYYLKSNTIADMFCTNGCKFSFNGFRSVLWDNSWEREWLRNGFCVL